ncbi:MAG: FAD-dependent oxidoreductase, partial [Desulfohalobiaceae bacterium]
MGGLAFLVIAFWLWRRGRAIWFVALPLVFMLIMPAWAMGMQIPEWLASDDPNWVLIAIATATLALEAWMIVEAVLLFPRVRGVLEEALPGQELPAEAVFFAVGEDLNSQLAKDIGVATNEHGAIVVDRTARTSIPRIYAAGDVTGGVNQIVTAVGEGSIAATSAYQDITKAPKPQK